MMEYVIAMCAMLAVVAAMACAVSAARRSALRTSVLVASDCP